MLTEKRQGKINRVVAFRQQGVIVLEDVHDPHNAAAVFRTAEVFGFQKVYLIFGKETPFNPKKIGKSSSSSANKWLDYKIYRSTKKCFLDLKKDGYEIIGTVIDDKAETMFKSKIDHPKIALVFGNEHQGLSAQATDLLDRKITIPMFGMVQSLNLSVTAGIFMFEVTRQRNGKKRYLLDRVAKEELASDFARR